MFAIFANWKTTAAGVATLALVGLSYIGVQVPGFDAASAPALIPIAIGLIFAHDGKSA